MAAKLQSSIKARIKAEKGYVGACAWGLVPRNVRSLLHGLREVVLEENELDDTWTHFVTKVMHTLQHARDLHNSDSVRHRLLGNRLFMRPSFCRVMILPLPWSCSLPTCAVWCCGLADDIATTDFQY